jgi:hypothetical protein
MSQLGSFFGYLGSLEQVGHASVVGGDTGFATLGRSGPTVGLNLVSVGLGGSEFSHVWLFEFELMN